MAKRAVNNFTDEWFESRGYIKTASGWDPPPVKSNYIKNLIGQNVIPSGTTHVDTKDILIQYPKEFIIPKVKVNETPDFTIKPVTDWFIPYQTPSKKNSRITFTNKKTGRVVNIPSQKYTEYKTATKMYWETFGREFKKTIELLDLQFPLNIEMTFTRKTNQLVDYFGPGESVFDLMTDYGWWEDDNRRFGKPFFGDMLVDKNNPGVRIKILISK